MFACLLSTRDAGGGTHEFLTRSGTEENRVVVLAAGRATLRRPLPTDAAVSFRYEYHFFEGWEKGEGRMATRRRCRKKRSAESRVGDG